ncbi:hypothetical protein ACFFRR_011682 [Megaselia abdita]
MEVIQEPLSCFFETEDKSVIYSLMDPDLLKESETIFIDDSDDVEIVENAKSLLKIKDVFPCGISSGCNPTKREDEPEHLLQCLLVKILKEFKTPSIHIEQICTIFSKRYKFFYNIPPYKLVRMIKDTIKRKNCLNQYKIVFSGKEHCVLLPSEDEVISLDSDDEDDVRHEIKLEYDVVKSEEVPEEIPVFEISSNSNDDIILEEDISFDDYPYQLSLKSEKLENLTDDVRADDELIPEEHVTVKMDEGFYTPEAMEVNTNEIFDNLVDQENLQPVINEMNMDVDESTQNSNSTVIQNTAIELPIQTSEDDIVDEEESPLVIDENPSRNSDMEKQTEKSSRNPEPLNESNLPLVLQEVSDNSTKNVYELHEEKESCNKQQVSKPQMKRICVKDILQCIQELKLSTFSVRDIVQYFNSKLETGNTKYAHVYRVLKRGKRFRQTVDKQWEVIEITEASKNTSYGPSAVGIRQYYSTFSEEINKPAPTVSNPKPTTVQNCQTCSSRPTQLKPSHLTCTPAENLPKSVIYTTPPPELTTPTAFYPTNVASTQNQVNPTSIAPLQSPIAPMTVKPKPVIYVTPLQKLTYPSNTGEVPVNTNPTSPTFFYPTSPNLAKETSSIQHNYATPQQYYATSIAPTQSTTPQYIYPTSIASLQSTTPQYTYAIPSQPVDVTPKVIYPTPPPETMYQKDIVRGPVNSKPNSVLRQISIVPPQSRSQQYTTSIASSQSSIAPPQSRSQQYTTSIASSQSSIAHTKSTSSQYTTSIAPPQSTSPQYTTSIAPTKSTSQQQMYPAITASIQSSQYPTSIASLQSPTPQYTYPTSIASLQSTTRQHTYAIPSAPVDVPSKVIYPTPPPETIYQAHIVREPLNSKPSAVLRQTSIVAPQSRSQQQTYPTISAPTQSTSQQQVSTNTTPQQAYATPILPVTRKPITYSTPPPEQTYPASIGQMPTNQKPAYPTSIEGHQRQPVTQDKLKESLLIVFANIMKGRKLTRSQLIKEIVARCPYFQSSDNWWMQMIDTYLLTFCFKISTSNSTEWILSDLRYKEISTKLL